MKITISREEWERKGDKLLINMATSRCLKNEYGSISERYIINECKSIEINGIKINATAFTVGTNHIEFGEISQNDVTDENTHKKLGTRYYIENPIAKMQYGTIKTLSFKQEIGTSGKDQTVSIYITDNYSKLKEMIQENI